MTAARSETQEASASKQSSGDSVGEWLKDVERRRAEMSEVKQTQAEWGFGHDGEDAG